MKLKNGAVILAVIGIIACIVVLLAVMMNNNKEKADTPINENKEQEQIEGEGAEEETFNNEGSNKGKPNDETSNDEPPNNENSNNENDRKPEENAIYKEEEGFYTYEYSIIVEGDRELTLKLYGNEIKENGLYSIYQMKVYNKEKLIQTIIVKDDIAVEWGEGTFNNGTESWFKDSGFTGMDINFDDSQDIGLMGWVPARGNLPYYYWIWNTKNQQFEYAFFLPNLKVDRQEQLLITEHVVSGQGDDTDYYRYNEDGTLLNVKRISRNFDFDSGKLLVQVYELVDGKLEQVDEYFTDVDE